MTANRHKRSNLLVADKNWQEESLTLKPRLIKKDGELTASFKVGTGKLFVIKQLDEFCANVRNSATATYGSVRRSTTGAAILRRKAQSGCGSSSGLCRKRRNSARDWRM